MALKNLILFVQALFGGMSPENLDTGTYHIVIVLMIIWGMHIEGQGLR